MDVKNTKELLVAIIDLIKMVRVVALDGITIADAIELAKILKDNPAFLEHMKLAAEGVDQVAAELKDLSLMEAAELVGAALEESKK